MRRLIIQYQVRPERVAENEALVRAVYAELASVRPAGLRYMTVKAADGVSFTHIASVETADGSNPLPSLASFREFQAGTADRFEGPPVSSEIEVVGSYRAFDG